MAMLSQKALCNFRTEKKTRVTFNFQDDDTHTHKIKWFLLLNAIGIGGGEPFRLSSVYPSVYFTFNNSCLMLKAKS